MIVYFHNQCPDGFAAAWVAKRKYPDAELVPLDHGLNQQQLDAIYIKAQNQDVLMLDYSLRTRELNDGLYSLAKSFRILDHHKTAEAVLAGASYATFDMNRSGAGLAWDYLFGEDSDRIGVNLCTGKVGLPRPWFIDYVEARDLWRWDSVPNAREICAYIGSQPFTIEAYNNLLNFTAEDAFTLGKGAQ